MNATMADTGALVKQAQLAAEALRERHGWTKADFARALRDELETSPPIGHNQPPEGTRTVAERVEEVVLQQLLDDLTRLMEGKTPELRGRASEIEAAATPERMKLPTNDKEAEKLPQFVDLCTKAIKRAQDMHDEIKEPYLRAGRTIDGYFNAIIARINGAKMKAWVLLNAYQTAKREKERALEKKRADAYQKEGFTPPPQTEARGRVRGAGGTGAVLVEKPTFTIEDFDKIGLIKLRKFIEREAIEKALRGYVLHHTKTEPDPAKIPPIAGVKFHMAAQTRVHG